jgi:hypothetical protein
MPPATKMVSIVTTSSSVEHSTSTTVARAEVKKREYLIALLRFRTSYPIIAFHVRSD